MPIVLKNKTSALSSVYPCIYKSANNGIINSAYTDVMQPGI